MKAEIHESCHKRRGPSKVSAGEQPFFTRTGQQLDIHCLPAEFVCCTTGENDEGEHIGFIGLARRGGGIVVGYPPETLREMAKQFIAMADHIDSEEEGK